ncbi:MAG: urease accessory protein UreE [Porticoccaceae bacterium]|jgi:urease accessory protein|nr:urease accessory protein UreE [Porticoccaceae bacterium]
MIRITQILQKSSLKISAAHDTTLSLPIRERTKSRIKVTLDDGREAGLFLPRGEILRGGDLVQSEEGLVVEINAAPETVSTVTSDCSHALARASYHLGNRHVPLQIEPDFLRYQHDHVLDEMVVGLGLSVAVEEAPFEPEAGAYKNASASHGHSHGHGHDH